MKHLSDEQIIGYLDRTLARDEAAAVAEHMAACPACAGAVRLAGVGEAAARQSVPVATDAELVDGVMRMVLKLECPVVISGDAAAPLPRAVSPGRRPRRLVTFVACCLVIAVVVAVTLLGGMPVARGEFAALGRVLRSSGEVLMRPAALTLCLVAVTLVALLGIDHVLERRMRPPRGRVHT